MLERCEEETTRANEWQVAARRVQALEATIQRLEHERAELMSKTKALNDELGVSATAGTCPWTCAGADACACACACACVWYHRIPLGVLLRRAALRRQLQRLVRPHSPRRHCRVAK